MDRLPAISATAQVYSTAPQSPSHERLIKKIADCSLNSPRNVTTNWDPSRAVTPEQLCGYKTTKDLKFFSFDGNGTVKLFRSDSESQGLISQETQVVAVSVTTEIETATKRKNESKGTFIQYDKNRVAQEGADFDVDAENDAGKVNYQGGHFIDHKYSAENSHTYEKNYIPMHYFYNSPIKEHLVQRSDAFVEIPLYTSNPPMIGVRGQQDNYHPIPVGIIFVQLIQNKIEDVYYFPNNDFDYKRLKDNLGLKKDLAANMIPYFKLEKSFHELLRAAIITDFISMQNGKSEQMERENKFFEIVDDVSFGMSLADCSEDETIISQLSFSVLHEEEVDPFLCLDCTEDQFAQLDDQPLEPAFNALGEFLVRYGIKNALKSEVLSVKSRLVFLNVIIDFIEAYTQVEEHALEFVDSLTEQFQHTLRELDKIVSTMNQEELFYLANTYQRLSSEGNHSFATENYEIYDFGHLEMYFEKFIQILKIIVVKHPLDSLDHDAAWSFLGFLQSADDVWNYISITIPEEFKKERRFLEKIRSPALKLLANLHQKELVDIGYQTNINRSTRMKTSIGYLQNRLNNLGSLPPPPPKDEED